MNMYLLSLALAAFPLFTVLLVAYIVFRHRPKLQNASANTRFKRAWW